MIFDRPLEQEKNLGSSICNDDTVPRIIETLVFDLCNIGTSTNSNKETIVTSIANVLLGMKKLCYLEDIDEGAITPRIPKIRRENYSAKVFKCISAFVDVSRIKRMHPDMLIKYGLTTGSSIHIAVIETLIRAMAVCIGMCTAVIRDRQISGGDIRKAADDILSTCDESCKCSSDG